MQNILLFKFFLKTSLNLYPRPDFTWWQKTFQPFLRKFVPKKIYWEYSFILEVRLVIFRLFPLYFFFLYQRLCFFAFMALWYYMKAYMHANSMVSSCEKWNYATIRFSHWYLFTLASCQYLHHPLSPLVELSCIFSTLFSNPFELLACLQFLLLPL